MSNPTITLDGVIYTAPEPKMGLWRKLQQFKDQSRKQAAELKESWKPIEAIKDDKEKVDLLEKIMDKVDQKIEQSKVFKINGMIDIILAAFPDIPSDKIDSMHAKDVQPNYVLIETWLDLVMSGRLSQLPNAETPTAE